MNFVSHSIKTVAALIAQRQEALQVTDAQIAHAVGYPGGQVIMMIKQGAMRLPVHKVAAMAEVLAIDPAELLYLVLGELSPDLLETIKAILDPMQLTQVEVNLINHVRELAKGQACTPLVIEGRPLIALIAA